MGKHSAIAALVVALLMAVVAVGAAVRGLRPAPDAREKASPIDTSAASTPPLADEPPTPRGAPGVRGGTAPPVVHAEEAPPAPAASGEATMMAELREMRQADPELSLRLARESNQRFPASPDAAERAEIVVKSLMRMGRADEATAEAKAMVAKYPGTVWAADVQHHMLDIPSYVPDAAVP